MSDSSNLSTVSKKSGCKSAVSAVSKCIHDGNLSQAAGLTVDKALEKIRLELAEKCRLRAIGDPCLVGEDRPRSGSGAGRRSADLGRVEVSRPEQSAGDVPRGGSYDLRKSGDGGGAELGQPSVQRGSYDRRRSDKGPGGAIADQATVSRGSYDLRKSGGGSGPGSSDRRRSGGDVDQAGAQRGSYDRRRSDEGAGGAIADQATVSRGSYDLRKSGGGSGPGSSDRRRSGGDVDQAGAQRGSYDVRQNGGGAEQDHATVSRGSYDLRKSGGGSDQAALHKGFYELRKSGDRGSGQGATTAATRGSKGSGGSRRSSGQKGDDIFSRAAGSMVEAITSSLNNIDDGNLSKAASKTVDKAIDHVRNQLEEEARLAALAGGQSGQIRKSGDMVSILPPGAVGSDALPMDSEATRQSTQVLVPVLPFPEESMARIPAGGSFIDKHTIPMESSMLDYGHRIHRSDGEQDLDHPSQLAMGQSAVPGQGAAVDGGGGEGILGAGADGGGGEGILGAGADGGGGEGIFGATQLGLGGLGGLGAFVGGGGGPEIAPDQLQDGYTLAEEIANAVAVAKMDGPTLAMFHDLYRMFSELTRNLTDPSHRNGNVPTSFPQTQSSQFKKPPPPPSAPIQMTGSSGGGSNSNSKGSGKLPSEVKERVIRTLSDVKAQLDTVKLQLIKQRGLSN